MATISDDSVVGGQTWRNLKHKAMKEGYEKEEWYKILSENDKELLLQLIEAQKAQEDMGELKPVRIILEMGSAAKGSM